MGTLNLQRYALNPNLINNVEDNVDFFSIAYTKTLL